MLNNRTRSTSPKQREKTCHQYYKRVKHTPEPKDCTTLSASPTASALPEHQPEDLYIEETYPESIVNMSLLLAARNKQKFKLEYHLYSPKKAKESKAKRLEDHLYPPKKAKESTAKCSDLPDIVRFTVPVTDQVFDISNSSFDKLKDTVFLLADVIDPDQIGHRNSAVLEKADEQGLVTINAYIDHHKDYARDLNRRIWCDTSLYLFFNEIRSHGDKKAGFIVTMHDPPKDISTLNPEYKQCNVVPLPNIKDGQVLHSQVSTQAIVDPLKAVYLDFQGPLDSIDHHKLDVLRGKSHLADYLIYASIAPEDIKNVLDLLRPHRINSFEKFLFPGILNVQQVVKWGVQYGIAMDLFFKAHDYYKYLLGKWNRNEI